ncbi:putative incF replication protein RepA3 [Escherichia coli P0304777.8]|nr:putative incF replication protein RepA3 [Escherichia coli P0304777.8]
MRHMNGEIKTGGETHRLFHQFFAELQRSGTFTGCKHRIRVLYLAVIRLLKISHTILHLQCAEGVSTERSLELFRAYNYTPRIAELLAIRFLDGPGNLLRRQT